MMSPSFSMYLLYLCLLCCIGDIYSSYEGRRVLLVTGNFTIDQVRSNVAQFDLRTGL